MTTNKQENKRGSCNWSSVMVWVWRGEAVKSLLSVWASCTLLFLICFETPSFLSFFPSSLLRPAYHSSCPPSPSPLPHFSRFRPPLRLSVFSLMCCQQGALATGCKSHRQGNILWSAVAEAFVGRRGDVNGCCILSSLDLLLRGEVRRSNIKSLMSVMHLSGCLT